VYRALAESGWFFAVLHEMNISVLRNLVQQNYEFGWIL